MHYFIDALTIIGALAVAAFVGSIIMWILVLREFK